jgi:cell division protein ZapA (FtsZ GTPase activity inhibitor)
MKQKYTLVISDVELNVVTEASKEAVEKIVGILDRKMRDINLKSYRCTKNQAALLCALEYCSEKLELQDRNAELEEIAEQDAATIAEQENKIAELQAEIEKLQGENEIMHNILERAAASTKRMMGNHEPAAEVTEAPEAAEASEAPEAPEAPEMPQAAEEPEASQAPEVTEALEEPEAPEQLTVDFDEAEQPAVNTKAAQVLEEIADSQTDAPRVKAKAKKAKSRSRVGSMFDLLTFNDV